MTMRSFLYLFLMLMNSGNSVHSGSLIERHGLSVSQSRLNRMGHGEVDRAFKRDLALALQCHAQSNLVNDVRFELALDRCVAYVNWLSKSKGGPHGGAFMRQCKEDLRQQVTESQHA